MIAFCRVVIAMALVAVAVANGDSSCSDKSSSGGNRGGKSDGSRLNGVGGNGSDQTGGADGHAAFCEKFAEPFDGTADALLRGVIRSAKRLADFAQAFVFKET